MNEADTCRKFVVPKLQAAGWETEPHSIAEQRPAVGRGFSRQNLQCMRQFFVAFPPDMIRQTLSGESNPNIRQTPSSGFCRTSASALHNE